MENKVKVDFSKANDCIQGKLVEADGVKFTVQSHIPISEKIAMANEIVNACTMIDDDVYYIGKNHLWNIVIVYLAVKYYTDIDTEGEEPTAIYDWAINTGAYNQIWDVIYDDIYRVDEIADDIFTYVESKYKKEHGLDTAVMKTFGSILSGEDIMETIDKSREVSEEMLDVVEKLGQTSQNGTVKVGGNVIQIAKKNK